MLLNSAANSFGSRTIGITGGLMSFWSRAAVQVAVTESGTSLVPGKGEGRGEGKETVDIGNWKRSWVSVTGVYNWLDCRVLIWFSFCLLSGRDVSSLPPLAQKGPENSSDATSFSGSFRYL